jgi:hypothetical protein
MLDIRLLNLDRNISNILVKSHFGRPLELVPIDHGFCLPERLSNVGLPRGTTSATVDWCWTEWPQAKIPLDPFAVKYLREIDIEADCERLREELGIPEGSLANMRLAHIILLKAAKFKVSLYRLAQLFTRIDFDKPSELENLCSNAEKLALNQLQRMMRSNDSSRARIDKKGYFSSNRKVAKCSSPKMKKTVRESFASSHSLQTSPSNHDCRQPFMDISEEIWSTNCVLGPNCRALSPQPKSSPLSYFIPRERLVSSSSAKSTRACRQDLPPRTKACHSANSCDDCDPNSPLHFQQEVTTTKARSFSFAPQQVMMRTPLYTCYKVAERIPEPLNLYKEKVLEAKFSPIAHSCDELEKLSLSPNTFSLHNLFNEVSIPHSPSLIEVSSAKAHSSSTIDLVIKHSDDNSYGSRRHQTITELDLDANSLRRHLKIIASPTPTPNLNPLTGNLVDGFSLLSPTNHRNQETLQLGMPALKVPRIIKQRRTYDPELETGCCEAPKRLPSTVPCEDLGYGLKLNKLFFLFLDRLTDLHLQKIMKQELKQNETEQEQSDDEETPETLFHWRNAMKKLNNPIKRSAMNRPLSQDNSSEELVRVKMVPRTAVTEYINTSSRSEYDESDYRSGLVEESGSTRSGLNSPVQFSSPSDCAQRLSPSSSFS